MAFDELHELKQEVRLDPQFAAALRSTDTAEQAAELVDRDGLRVAPEALWHHSGMLNVTDADLLQIHMLKVVAQVSPLSH